MKTNQYNTDYQKQLDAVIKECAAANETPSLLLHSCCGPCSSYVIEYLSQFFQISLFYYNPNILPENEYNKRLTAQKQILNALPTKHLVKFIEGDYEPEKFLLAVSGYEDEPEGGKRCAVCFRLRLEESARLAKKSRHEYFCTTLSVSPYKNAAVLAEISEQLSAEYQVKSLPADFKKRGGYQRSIELAREYDIYRQTTCGCPFSGKT